MTINWLQISYLFLLRTDWTHLSITASPKNDVHKKNLFVNTISTEHLNLFRMSNCFKYRTLCFEPSKSKALPQDWQEPVCDPLLTMSYRSSTASRVWLQPVNMLRKCFCILFSRPGQGWKKRFGGQWMNWRRDMRKLASVLSLVGTCQVCIWSPKDEDWHWLKTLKDMT